MGLGVPPAQGLAGGNFGPKHHHLPLPPALQQPWFAPHPHPPPCASHIPRGQSPRRLRLTPGSPAPNPDLAPGSGSAAAPCSRSPCSLPSLSPLPSPALAPSWPLPTSLGPSPAFYKPGSFSRSPLSAPSLSPHRVPGCCPGEDPALDVRGMRLLPAARLEARGPRPQPDRRPGPDGSTSHPTPQAPPAPDQWTNVGCRSVGHPAPKLQGPRRDCCCTNLCSV